jgi:hypothetical protein
MAYAAALELQQATDTSAPAAAAAADDSNTSTRAAASTSHHLPQLLLTRSEKLCGKLAKELYTYCLLARPKQEEQQEKQQALLHRLRLKCCRDPSL